MREILFKAMRLDNGEWVYGYLYITHTGQYEIGAYDAETNIERITYIVDPATVCQYTGLTDKNGVKIFEGDRVQALSPSPFANTTGTVTFSDGCFDVTFDRKDYWRDCLQCLTCNHECGEIIGSIHDKEAAHA